MRRGCISLGNIKCDECHRTIPYPDRYLYLEEEGKSQRLCTDCCKKRKLIKPGSDKPGAEILFDLSSD